MRLDRDNNVPYFIKKAKLFADKHQRKFIFRLLKRFLQCDESGLRFVISKLYCLSIESSQSNREDVFRTFFGVLISSFYILFSKDLFWVREEPVHCNFETVDAQYFNSRFAQIYESLKGSKRLTPRLSETFQRDDITKGVFSTTCFLKSIQLFIFSWAAYIPLIIFCMMTRLNILRAYREAMSIYVVFDAYFKRYPCTHFITYADDTNHPSRYFAFKNNCSGKLIVIQNGERGYHPSWSFGMVDYYFIFGEAYIEMVRQLSYEMEDAFPVGSLGLNQHYGKLKAQDQTKEFDILYIDNGSISPPDYGGLEESVARSEEIIFSNLSKLKSRNKDYKIVYQLRHYEDNIRRKYVIDVVKKHFNEEILILSNDGVGESYKNIIRSKLVITFQSTMGFESMILGIKTLFINYSGHRSETLCKDARFQIDDIDHNYEYFENMIKELLSLENYSIPEIAYERHYLFDGGVQKRIINILKTKLQ